MDLELPLWFEIGSLVILTLILRPNGLMGRKLEVRH